LKKILVRSFLTRNLGRVTIGERPVVERVSLPLNGLHPALEGFKIVQLSDLHLQPYTQLKAIATAVAQANRLKPDLIVLTGDYVSLEAETVFEIAPVLASLNARYGVFTVLGNHDIWTNREVVQAGLREAGLPLLHNQGVPLSVGRGTIYLAGLDDGWIGQPDLKLALQAAPSGAPVILLAHEPDLADHFTLDPRVSVQLSGHTHGGQIRLPGFGAAVLPHLGRKYDHGLYRVNQSWLYTNRGIGYTSVPIRINCPPEITEITLTRQGKAN
jgi:predicted MPP superfamily phosphohydrolase